MASLIVDQVDQHHDEQVINSIQNRKLSFTNAIPEIKDEPVINVEPSSDDFYEEQKLCYLVCVQPLQPELTHS